VIVEIKTGGIIAQTRTEISLISAKYATDSVGQAGVGSELGS